MIKGDAPVKTLLVYYSRTGRTEAAVKRLSELLSAERCVKIRPKTPREGGLGMLRCLREMFGKPEKIEPHDVPPVMGEYDLVVVGTPVWGGGLSGPVRAFMEIYGKNVRKYALVEASSGPSEQQKRTAEQMEGITGLAPAAVLGLCSKDSAEKMERELNEFAEKLKGLPS